MTRRWIQNSWGIAAALMTLAAALRVWGLDFGLPFLYHPDEPGYVAIAQTIFKTGDLNPHFFNYPSLFFYLNALSYVPFYGIGQLLGAFSSPADIVGPVMLIGGSGKALLPSAFLLGRGLSTAFGIASVGLTFALARRATKRVSVGILAALLLAVSPTHVANSRFIAPDVFLVFFLLLATWCAFNVLERGRAQDYALAGIAVGLAGATKYNAVLIAIVIFAAHWLRAGRKNWRDRKIFLIFVGAGMAFLAATPFALLDAVHFLEGIRIEAAHYRTGHAGNAGDSLVWYLDFLWKTEGPAVFLGMAGIVWAVTRRSKQLTLIAVFPAVYFVFISTFVVHNERTAMPLLPFFFTLAAAFLIQLVSKNQREKTIRWAGVVLAVVCLAWPLARTLADNRQLTTINSLETARVWIDENVPAGARVAVESYAPFVEPTRFKVQGFYKLIDNSADWYVQNKFEYLVFSQRMFRRFYADRIAFADEVARYEALFSAFEEVKTFTDGGYEVRIYRAKTRALEPAPSF